MNLSKLTISLSLMSGLFWNQASQAEPSNRKFALIKGTGSALYEDTLNGESDYIYLYYTPVAIAKESSSSSFIQYEDKYRINLIFSLQEPLELEGQKVEIAERIAKKYNLDPQNVVFLPVEITDLESVVTFWDEGSDLIMKSKPRASQHISSDFSYTMVMDNQAFGALLSTSQSGGIFAVLNGKVELVKANGDVSTAHRTITLDFLNNEPCLLEVDGCH